MKPKPSIKAVVLVPSKELVRQVADHFVSITKFCKNVTSYAINSDGLETEQK
jgi:superfamily II DNA/RNA helicase